MMSELRCIKGLRYPTRFIKVDVLLQLDLFSNTFWTLLRKETLLSCDEIRMKEENS